MKNSLKKDQSYVGLDSKQAQRALTRLVLQEPGGRAEEFWAVESQSLLWLLEQKSLNTREMLLCSSSLFMWNVD